VKIDAGIDPRLGAETVIGMLRGVMLQRVIEGRRQGMTAMRDHFLHMMRRAFAPLDAAAAPQPRVP